MYCMLWVHGFCLCTSLYIVFVNHTFSVVYSNLCNICILHTLHPSTYHCCTCQHKLYYNNCTALWTVCGWVKNVGREWSGGGEEVAFSQQSAANFWQGRLWGLKMSVLPLNSTKMRDFQPHFIYCGNKVIWHAIIWGWDNGQLLLISGMQTFSAMGHHQMWSFLKHCA